MPSRNPKCSFLPGRVVPSRLLDEREAGSFAFLPVLLGKAKHVFLARRIHQKADVHRRRLVSPVPIRRIARVYVAVHAGPIRVVRALHERGRETLAQNRLVDARCAQTPEGESDVQERTGRRVVVRGVYAEVSGRSASKQERGTRFAHLEEQKRASGIARSPSG